MTEKPNVARQVRFGTDGSMEADEEVDTDFSDWGIHEEGPKRETRIEQEQASQFGIDDRTEVEQTSQTEQGKLFAKRSEKQMGLDGKAGGMEAQYED